MLEAAKPRHRYVALDSLRGICACMIALHHFEALGHIGTSTLVRNSFLFVDFFFVLSGFVIGSSYGARLAQGFPVHRFMALRLWRIYPLHVAILLVYAAFELVFGLLLGLGGREALTGDHSPAVLGYTLLLVQIFFGPEATPWNGPSWSIAAEVWTYLIFALLLRHAARWLVPVCLLIVLTAPIFLAALSDRYLVVIHDGALLRCLFGFSLGMVGWRCADRMERLRLSRTSNAMVEILIVALIVALVSGAGAGPLSLAAPFLFLAAVLIFAREQGPLSRLLRRAPFVLIGTLSYAIYMIHSFILFRFINILNVGETLTGRHFIESVDGHAQIGGGALFADAMSGVFLLTVIVCAWFTYHFVELPVQRFGRRRLDNTPPAPAPAMSAAP
jgi:peptidoglycan/LPS O-acetylase OafA/YrhL